MIEVLQIMQQLGEEKKLKTSTAAASLL